MGREKALHRLNDHHLLKNIPQRKKPWAHKVSQHYILAAQMLKPWTQRLYFPFICTIFTSFSFHTKAVLFYTKKVLKYRNRHSTRIRMHTICQNWPAQENWFSLIKMKRKGLVCMITHVCHAWDMHNSWCKQHGRLDGENSQHSAKLFHGSAEEEEALLWEGGEEDDFIFVSTTSIFFQQTFARISEFFEETVPLYH